jgi:CO/xanthine dehydrogenase Mo-binding subunit
VPLSKLSQAQWRTASVFVAFEHTAYTVMNSMEPRGCLAECDRDQDRYTIRCTVQSVHGTRAALADRIFKLPQHQFRVVCDNMGGGFGMKGTRNTRWRSGRSDPLRGEQPTADPAVSAE